MSESSTVEHDRLARNCPRHPGLYVALENFGASEQSWDSQSLRLRASGSGRIHGDRARVLRALGRERGGRELDVREEGSLRELCDKALGTTTTIAAVSSSSSRNGGNVLQASIIVAGCFSVSIVEEWLTWSVMISSRISKMSMAGAGTQHVSISHRNKKGRLQKWRQTCRSLVFFFAARRKPHANALRRERGPRRKRSGELQRREALARRLGAAWTWVRNGHRMSKACGYRLEGTGGGA